MALLKCDMMSMILLKRINLNIIIPSKNIEDLLQNDMAYTDMRYKTLYLLHGTADNENAWLYNTNILEYAEKNKLLVVMPDVGNSYYTDMVHGGKFQTFIEEELYQFIQTTFPSSSEIADNYIIGNSMGGYGAVKLGLNNPDKFGSIASFCGSINITKQFDTMVGQIINFHDVFGNLHEVAGSINDPFYLLEQSEQIANIYLRVGSKDFNLHHSSSFSKALIDKQIKHSFIIDDGYDHSWEYWDFCIKEYIEEVVKC